MALPVITDAVGARVSITPEMFRQSMLQQSLPRISAGSDQDNTSAVQMTEVRERQRRYSEMIQMQLLVTRSVRAFTAADRQSTLSSLKRCYDKGSLKSRVSRKSLHQQSSSLFTISSENQAERRHKGESILQRRLRMAKMLSRSCRRPASPTSVAPKIPRVSTSTQTSLGDSLDYVRRLEETGDKLLDTIYYLYTSTDSRLSCRKRSEVHRAYRKLFQQQEVPLTTDNLDVFLHDVGVSAMEKECEEIQQRLQQPSQKKLQVPSPTQQSRFQRYTTVRRPKLVKQLIADHPSLLQQQSQNKQQIRKPWEKLMCGTEFPVSLHAGGSGEVTSKETAAFEGSMAPVDKQLKEVQRDIYRRLQEAAVRRRSLRCRKRWLKSYRKVQTVLKICKNMAVRSIALELEPSTYVDIGDRVTASVSYGDGRNVDTEQFKARKEICISSQAKDILTSCPEDRTLVQVESARRELQKVEVFSNYPIEVQERMIRGAFYITIGPKRVIVRQGHLPQAFYIIICGEAYAKLHQWDEKTGEHVVQASLFFKTGQTFGSAALVDGKERNTSVISRTNMQLLAINGEDYLDIFWNPSRKEELPPHHVYISQMNFMENFPIDVLRERPLMCTLHHFTRNRVITHDSRQCRCLYIIRSGYCKVFRKLNWVDEATDVDQASRKKRSTEEQKQADMIRSANQLYIERDSPYVTYYETRTPAGNTVRVPVTRMPLLTDKLEYLPLSLPSGPRQFVPLMLLREGEVFGLDQTPMCPYRSKSRTVILVSLGAEVIALNKNLYCRHASPEAREVVEKTFIYNDEFIRRRVAAHVNRDVHLEEVLKHHFDSITYAHSEINKQEEADL